jgi:hypothetical protein
LKIPTLRKPLEEPLDRSTVRTAWLGIVASAFLVLIFAGYATMESDLLARGLKIGSCLFWAYTIFKLLKILRENRNLTAKSEPVLQESR